MWKKKAQEAQQEGQDAASQKKEEGRDLYEWVQALVCSVLAVVLLFTFAVRVVLVSGPSMRETLQDQDCLLVLNAPLCGGFETGDIVIIQRDDFRDGEPIVKRIVATEGQTVDIDFDAGMVYVDGQLLEETYIREPTHLEEGLEFPVTVPEGCVFVLGDNRDPDLGPVDTREILGRAVALLFPGVTAASGERDFGRIGPLTYPPVPTTRSGPNF